ncbi:MAG: hypothetical protein JWO36_1526 [Myxococcales bacterium]|nr:hypothetical protein [Myxococcales bacterium]
MDDEPDLSLEWKLRAGAVPAAFLIALVFHASPTGHFLQRTWLTMIPHELGHAITAWWCGFGAVPVLWKTLIPETRGAFAVVLVAAFELYMIVRGYLAQRSEDARTVPWMWIGLAFGALQFYGTSVISAEHAHAAITFGGDGGAMVIGAALVFTFFVRPGTRLHTTGLRWGFLAIGAATLVDTSATWISARTDTDAIPFGEIEGVGLSDPSKLIEDYGWTTRHMVDRYVTLATICFVIAAAAWAWAVWSARREATATGP